MNIQKDLEKRILVLDGAMGTMIQNHQLEEEDFRGKRFASHPCPLKGNNDLLSLSQPDLIKEIHRAYLEAGADLLETNTFSSTSIGMADYQMEDLAYELNYESAKIAKEVTREFSAKTRSTKNPKVFSTFMYSQLEKHLKSEIKKLDRPFKKGKGESGIVLVF